MLKKVGIDISLTKVERMKDCLIGFYLLIEGRFLTSSYFLFITFIFIGDYLIIFYFTMFLTFRKDNFHNGSYIENIVLKISLIFKILC